MAAKIFMKTQDGKSGERFSVTQKCGSIRWSFKLSLWKHKMRLISEHTLPSLSSPSFCKCSGVKLSSWVCEAPGIAYSPHTEQGAARQV